MTGTSSTERAATSDVQALRARQVDWFGLSAGCLQVRRATWWTSSRSNQKTNSILNFYAWFSLSSYCSTWSYLTTNRRRWFFWKKVMKGPRVENGTCILCVIVSVSLSNRNVLHVRWPLKNAVFPFNLVLSRHHENAGSLNILNQFLNFSIISNGSWANECPFVLNLAHNLWNGKTVFQRVL